MPTSYRAVSIYCNDVYFTERYNNIDQVMQQKKQKLKRIIRKQYIESKLKKCREKQMLLDDLETLLSNYSHCSLVNGQDQYLSHHNYLDCEHFIIETHQQLYELIQELSIKQTKSLLITHSLPQKLIQVKEFVENKTLQNDQKSLQIHLLSKNKVLKTICHLFSLLTQDEDLVFQMAEDVINLFCLQLRSEFPIKKQPEADWDLPIIGLINMFCYSQTEDFVYYGLKQSNFQNVIQNYFQNFIFLKKISYQTCESRENREFTVNVVILLKYYLQYQIEKSEDKLWRKFEAVLATYIIQNIKNNILIDRYFHKDVSQNQLIDELLKLCLWTNIQLNYQFEILKNRDLFKKNGFAQLFNYWSHQCNLQINLDSFSDEELCELFECAKQRIGSFNFDAYQNNLVGAVMNMLQQVLDAETSAKRLWRLLQQTKTVHLFADSLSQNPEVKMLGEMLNVYLEGESQVV